MSPYIHQLPDWPKFSCDQEALAAPLAAVRHRQGRLLGRMEALGFSLRKEAELETLTLDVLKSSEIEGEVLNPEQVRSSIARRLGMDIAGVIPTDRNVEGVVEMMLDATQNFDKPLTTERLFGWHAALFPMGHSGMLKIAAGAWRDDSRGPMEVVSGAMGRERVHYEAPAAHLLHAEMTRFINWANPPDRTDPVLRSAIAHLWFVTIHPFDDGNGRIARAIADWVLSQSENSSQRFYSMSAQIRLERNAYYDILEKTQKGTLDITPWIEWFLGCLGRAFEETETTLTSVLRKARFWEKHRETMSGANASPTRSVSATARNSKQGRSHQVTMNERQRLMLNKMLDGCEGKSTSSKWAKLAKCSQDTAYRDIQYLIEYDILVKDPTGGRSTSYSLRD